MDTEPTQQTPAPDALSGTDNTDFGNSFGDLLDKAFAGHDSEGNPPPDSEAPDSSGTDAKDPGNTGEKGELGEPGVEEPTPTTTVEDEEAPKNMSPKAAEKWAVLKAKTKAAEERVAELEKKISESQVSGESSSKAEAELQSVQQKLAEYEAKFKEQENEIAVNRVEATDEYKQVVVAPMQQLVSQIESLSKKYEVPLDGLLRAIVAGPDDSSLEEAVGSFSARDQTRIFNFQEQYLEIQNRRESIRNNAQEAMRVVEERRQQKAQESAAAENKMWEKALEDGWEELKQSTPLFAEMEKIPDRKAQADEIKNFVRSGKIINMSPNEKARLLYQGAAAPVLESIAREFFNENKQLKEKLGALQAATPSPSSGSSSVLDSSEEGDIDFEKLIEKKLRS